MEFKMFNGKQIPKELELEGITSCPKVKCLDSELDCDICILKPGSSEEARVAEYLGGKDVKEFEEGDRVECIDNSGDFASDRLDLGQIYTVDKLVCGGSQFELKETGSITPNINRFKLAGTKPKTTKENKVMSININSTVAKVFKDVDEAALVTKWVGSEYEENNHRAFMDLNKNSKLVLTYVIDLEKEAEAKK